MTNNLVVRSPIIHFVKNFTVLHNPEQGQEIASPIAEREVIAFSIAQDSYDIRSFDQYGTIADMRGLSLFMFRPNEKQGIIYLKEQRTPGPYNMQLIFNESYARDPRLFCKYDYLNRTTHLNVTMDFPTSTVEVFINGKSCIKYRLATQIFPVAKAVISMIAYSSKSGTILIKLNESSIYKVATIMPEVDSFHSNVNSIVNHLHRYDPLHAHNASLTNIMLIEVDLLGKD